MKGTIYLEDGSIYKGKGIWIRRNQSRRTGLQHGDDRLSENPDRPVL